MKTFTHRFAHGRLALKLAIGAALLPTAWASYSEAETAPVASPSPATPHAAPELPAEFRAIHPAGFDGSVPPIPPSELWPAQ